MTVENRIAVKFDHAPSIAVGSEKLPIEYDQNNRSASVRSRSGAASRFFGPMIMAAAFLACGLLSFILYLQEQNSAEAYGQLQFDRRVELRTLLIEQGLRSYEQLLIGGVGLFRASRDVDTLEWQRYIETEHLPERFPGVRGLGFTLRIATANRSSFEADRGAIQDGPFVITPETSQPVSMPVILHEPRGLVGDTLIGFDMYADPVRRAAMDKAMDAAAPVMSDNLVLNFDQDANGQPGFLVYAPVYRESSDVEAGDDKSEIPLADGSTLTLEARREQLHGFVYSAFRMEDMVLAIMGEDKLRLLRLQIYDGNTERGKLVFDSLQSGGQLPIADLTGIAGTPAETGSAFVSSARFRFAQNNWTLKFSSLPGFEAAIARQRPLFILFGGLLISALLAVSIGLWLASHRRAVALAVTNSSLENVLGRLSKAENELNRFFQLAPDILCILDGSGRFIRVNAAVRQVLDIQPEQLLATEFREILQSKEQRALQDVFDSLAGGQETAVIREFAAVSATGRQLVLECAFSRTDHKQIYVAGRDVTTRQAALIAKRQLIAAMESTSDIIFFCDETGYISYLNYRGRALITSVGGEERVEDFGDMEFNIYDFTPEWAITILNSEAFPYALAHGGWSGDIAILVQGGREVPVALVLEAHYHDEGGGIEFFAGNMRDISHRKKMQQDLEHKAYHDELTGLMNRQGFNERLARTMINAQEQLIESALLFLDLDHFKLVNDACGHAAGDEVLKQLSALFGQQIRDRDTLARLGGDEFTVILEQCQVTVAEQIAQSIVQATSDYRFFCEGRAFRFGASIGLVPIDRHTRSVKELLAAADDAAYRAKAGGRSQVVVHESGRQQSALQHINDNWEDRLRRALDQNLFVLQFQPIVQTSEARNDLRLREVLIRLRETDGELIQPSAFLPAARRFGLSGAVDLWVVEHVVQHIRTRELTDGITDVYAINISAESLQENGFSDRMIALVAERGVNPASLCFELSENTVLKNIDVCKAFIERMKAFGLQITLEHFGLSIGEFVKLQQLGVDFLKIDSWFVERLLNSEIDDHSLRFVNDMGHTMGLLTIAGAVSDPVVEARLRALGVDFLQGFHIGAPGEDAGGH